MTLWTRRTQWGGIRLRWVWYDLWVGLYVARDPLVLYLCPLPTVLVEVAIRRSR